MNYYAADWTGESEGPAGSWSRAQPSQGRHPRQQGGIKENPEFDAGNQEACPGVPSPPHHLLLTYHGTATRWPAGPPSGPAPPLARRHPPTTGICSMAARRLRLGWARARCSVHRPPRHVMPCTCKRRPVRLSACARRGRAAVQAPPGAA
jgi:hypothetical protein